MSDIWAITAYFNPVGYERRLANYHVFRSRLSVPLVTVELAYGEEFELGEGDADVLVQLRSTDILWQKERLLNIALTALPLTCRKVVWVDCDVVFGSDDWAQRASRRLDDIALLQPFSRVHYLTSDAGPNGFRPANAEMTRSSLAAMTASGLPAGNWLTELRDRRHPPGVGLAWAARRDVLDRNGLYDACVVGGGDRAIVAAASGSFSELMDSQNMNLSQRLAFLNWARPFHTETGSVDGYVDGNLFHLWHGKSGDRSYGERHAGLSAFEFDPSVDIAVDENGALRWNSDKPALHEYVRAYFLSRNEDG